MFSRRKPTNDCCYRLTSSNAYTAKKMCSRWYRSQFNKFEKAWVRVEILCLDFRKTPSNWNIKLSKVATFEKCEIFSNYYFSCLQDYKATLADGNKVELHLIGKGYKRLSNSISEILKDLKKDLHHYLNINCDKPVVKTNTHFPPLPTNSTPSTITAYTNKITSATLTLRYKYTAWNMSKYGVISGPYFPVFSLNRGKYGPETTLYLNTFHAVIRPPEIHRSSKSQIKSNGSFSKKSPWKNQQKK